MNVYPDVPVWDSTLNQESRPLYLAALKEMKARRVWITFEREMIFRNDRKEFLNNLKDLIDYFHENSMEVGLWTSSLGYGGPSSDESAIQEKQSRWMRIRPVSGGQYDSIDAFCPEDSGFVENFLSWVKDLAGLGAELLMLDDELCLSVRPGIGCFCDRHMKLLADELGESLELEKLPKLIFTGGKNRYRDAWLDVMGDSLRNFCFKIRETVDSVNDKMRVGLCAGFTSWDIEGVDAIELTRILAGDTQPFLRFTSAPYWVAPTYQRFPAQKLNSVIESARLQNYWCKDKNIEVFAENDSYPRPSYHISASLLEQFDAAMQAEGIRSLKYVFDYVSSVGYEKKYLQMHKRNIPFYEYIGSIFEDKQAEGVRLFRPMHTIRECVLPEEFVGERNIMRLFFSRSAAMLTGVGIPVCYEGDTECGAAFGEDVLAIPEVPKYKKLIIDFPAARLLTEKGVDVGLESFCGAQVPSCEHFEEECVNLSFIEAEAPMEKTGGFYEVKLKDDAAIQSVFQSKTGDYVSSYIYNSGETEFLVFTFDTLAVGEASSVFVSYCRQKQLMDFVGGKYPYIIGQTGIYSLCASSEDRKKQAVLFENIGGDPAFDFSIELGRECSDFTIFGAEGKLAEDRRSIRITSDFAPSAAMALELWFV